MTRAAISEDDIELLDSAGAHGEREHRELARHFEELAADPHPDDEVSPAALLVHAGERLRMVDDFAGALAYFRRAAELSGHVEPDVRCYLIQGLVDCKLYDEAAQLERAIRKARPRDPFVYEFVGETFELDGDLARAIGWFTAGMLLALRDDSIPESTLEMLTTARARARGAMGFPPDEFDDTTVFYAD